MPHAQPFAVSTVDASLPSQDFADRIVASYTAALKATRALRGEARHAARKRLSADFMRLMDMARLIEGPRSFSIAI